MMTKKRFLKSKDSAYQDRLSEAKAISISQGVIVKNVCEQTLLNSSVKAQLPTDLNKIYQNMMSDLSFIKRTQIAKDKSYYNCNMAFWKGEESICLKRKAIINLMTKKKKTNSMTDDSNSIKNEKKDKISRKTTENKIICNSIDLTEHESEDSRPHRKRKLPAKFKTENPKGMKDCNCVTNVNDGVLINVHENKLVTISQKIKEHILLDKINCVSQWTDAGLRVSKIAESDFVVLIKRLAIVNCTLSDLTEHSDEDNNKFLSVLIRQPTIVNTPDKLSENQLKDEKLLSNINIESTIIPNRHKSRQYVTAIYRPRHNFPNILSKPVLPNQDQLLSKRSDSWPTFSAIQSGEDPVDIVPPQTVNNQPSDPCMSASRLMKLKSDRCHVTAQASSTEAPQPSLPNNVTDVVPPHTTIIYRALPRNIVLPLYLSPLPSIVPLAQRPFRVPLLQYNASEPLPTSHNLTLTHIRPTNKVTTIQSAHNTILKNLLQQSAHSHQQMPQGSSTHMVPFSVFNGYRPGTASMMDSYPRR